LDVPSGEADFLRRVERTDTGRVVAFSDGVMAVAITLLVLNLDVPDLPSSREDELGEELVDLLPGLGAYALAFALVGRYWVIHHRLFERLRSFDGLLMSLNLCFLAFIVLMPFGAELIDRYDDQAIAAAVFGALLGLAGLTNWAMVHHVLRRGHAREDARDLSEPVSLALALIFFLSAAVAFLSTLLAHLMWLATIVLRYPLKRLAG
jgi:uncharacterized membrane protein